MIKRLKIVVSGRVQGVYFRKYTCDQAIKLGVVGLVKNLPDGSVYIEAEGEEQALETFIQWCHKGPVLAKVNRVTYEEMSVMGSKEFVVSR